MSELTPCNWCSMQRYYSDARRERQRIVVMPATKKDKYFLGGFNVYVFPKALYTRAQFRRLPPDEQEHWWVSWMWEITDRCVC